MISILICLYASSLFTFIFGSLICSYSTITLDILSIEYAIYLICLHYLLRKVKQIKPFFMGLSIIFTFIIYPLKPMFLIFGFLSLLLLYQLKQYMDEANNQDFMVVTGFGIALSLVIIFFNRYESDFYNIFGTSLILQCILILIASTISHNKALLLDKDALFIQRFKQGLFGLYIFIFLFTKPLFNLLTKVIRFILLILSYLLNIISTILIFLFEKGVYYVFLLLEKLNIHFSFKPIHNNAANFEILGFTEYVFEETNNDTFLLKGLIMLVVLVLIAIVLFNIFKRLEITQRAYKQDNNEIRSKVIRTKKEKKKRINQKESALTQIRLNYKKVTEKIIKSGKVYKETMTPSEFIHSLDTQTINDYDYQTITDAYNIARYKNNE